MPIIFAIVLLLAVVNTSLLLHNRHVLTTQNQQLRSDHEKNLFQHRTTRKALVQLLEPEEPSPQDALFQSISTSSDFHDFIESAAKVRFESEHGEGSWSTSPVTERQAALNTSAGNAAVVLKRNIAGFMLLTKATTTLSYEQKQKLLEITRTLLDSVAPDILARGQTTLDCNKDSFKADLILDGWAEEVFNSVILHRPTFAVVKAGAYPRMTSELKAALARTNPIFERIAESARVPIGPVINELHKQFYGFVESV
jgi:hypothetical protein